MTARVATATATVAFAGTDGLDIDVKVQIANDLPAFTNVGPINLRQFPQRLLSALLGLIVLMALSGCTGNRVKPIHADSQATLQQSETYLLLRTTIEVGANNPHASFWGYDPATGSPTFSCFSYEIGWYPLAWPVQPNTNTEFLLFQVPHGSYAFGDFFIKTERGRINYAGDFTMIPPQRKGLPEQGSDPAMYRYGLVHSYDLEAARKAVERFRGKPESVVVPEKTPMVGNRADNGFRPCAP
jgi:hypothetical protein